MNFIRCTFLFVFMILLTVPELFLHLFGINLFLAGSLVFYSSCVFGVPYGLACALLCGGILDFCSGWTIAWSIPFYLLMVPLSRFWFYRMDSESKWLLALPGFLFAFFVVFPAGVFAGDFSSGNLAASFSDSVITGIAGAVLFPLLISMLDFFSSRLKAGNYGDARKRMNEEEE